MWPLKLHLWYCRRLSIPLFFILGACLFIYRPVAVAFDYKYYEYGLVNVIANFESDKTQSGSGFVIGVDGRTALILTALHIVVQEKQVSAEKAPNLEEPQNLEIVFRSKPYEKFTGDLFSEVNEALDFAVVVVHAGEQGKNLPGNFPKFKLGRMRILETGAIVSAVACATPSALSLSTGNSITDTNVDGDYRKFKISKGTISDGFSGGPVLDDGGLLIGMVSRKGSNYAVVTKADDIYTPLTEWFGPKALNLVSKNFPADLIITVPEKISLGHAADLKASVHDAGGNTLTGFSPTWSSSDTSVVKVKDANQIVGISMGEAVITAECEGLRESATVQVTGGMMQIQFSAVPNKTSLSGKVVTIGLVARNYQGYTVPAALVKLRASGGEFIDNKQRIISGRTDSIGIYKSKWRCTPPCTRDSYNFKALVEKTGYENKEVETKVSIDTKAPDINKASGAIVVASGRSIRHLYDISDRGICGSSRSLKMLKEYSGMTDFRTIQIQGGEAFEALQKGVCDAWVGFSSPKISIAEYLKRTRMDRHFDTIVLP